jgi:hypothetical protein
MILNEVMKETAEAIREKTGKSELIAPVDFAEEIKGITAGGESGGSSWRFFDVSKMNDKTMARSLMPFLVKDNSNISFIMMISDWTNVQAIGVDGEAMIVIEGTKMSWNTVMQLEGVTPEVMVQLGMTEITKEEFYTLD